MGVVKSRQIFQDIRRALDLMEKENYTKAFNLLSAIEKKINRPYVAQKILPLKMHCLVQVGNLRSAIEYIEEKISKNPVTPFYYHEAAKFYHKVGKYDQANRYYLRSVCLAPQRIDYAISFSHFLREKSSLEKSLEILFRCLKENRKKKSRISLAILYQELGLIYYQKKFYLRALVFLNFCHKAWENFAYRDLLADSCLQKGRYHESLFFIEKHLKQWGGNDPDALYIKAKALAALGEKERALACLNKCQKIWGELVVTGGDLAHLYGLVQDGSIRRIPNVSLVF